jgi:hypothetical protein
MERNIQFAGSWFILSETSRGIRGPMRSELNNAWKTPLVLPLVEEHTAIEIYIKLA